MCLITVEWAGMDDTSAIQEMLAHLVELEEDIFIARFHQQV
jgi:hypothetical protein